MNQKPKYTYARANGGWAVYKMTYFENGSIGTKISTHFTLESAQAEVYRLNGWKSKNDKSKNHTEVKLKS